MNGVVFYDGPSKIDGSPIIGVATWGTANPKTGNIVQTWILRKDMNPIEAINTGADSGICGDCPLRGMIRPAEERTKKNIKLGSGDTVNKGRGCYVAVQNAPLAIFRAYGRGLYPTLSSVPEAVRRALLGRGLRYGSYGDPVAIPVSAWDKLAKYCTGRAEPGYTHQWRNPRFKAWRTRIMASTHSVGENDLAVNKGWRTFRTVKSVSDISPLEIICPASEEGGFKATCETCGACNGRRNMEDVRKSIAIVVHGGDAKIGGAMRAIEAASV